MIKLKGKNDEESLKELKKIITKIAENAENKYKQIKTELKGVDDGERPIDHQKILKIKKRICPNSEPPSAMFDVHGNLLTSK